MDIKPFLESNIREEIYDLHYLICVYNSQENDTRGASATYLATDCEVTDCIYYAESSCEGNDTWSIGLLRVRPLGGYEVSWLVGADGNDSINTEGIGHIIAARQKGMLSRRKK